MNYLIKNGTIVDGTGKNSYVSDLLISEGIIKEISSLKEVKKAVEIDADQMIVCPGFVDVNTHSDTFWTLFEYPGQESLITQGITTIVGGNCGSSLAPLINREAIKSIQRYIDTSITHVKWSRFREFMDFLEKKEFNPNFGSLVGHSTLRRAFTGDEPRLLREEELQIIIAALDDAMQQGALGLSSGLVYSHVRVTPLDEIIKLARVVKKYNGVYATHVRGEGSDLIKSIEEAITVCEKTQVKLEISHLKTCGRDNWSLQDKALELIEDASRRGLDINFDVYPYTQAGPVLYTLLPTWVSEGGKEALLRRLKDKKTREKVIKEMSRQNIDYDQILISIIKTDYPLSRKKVGEIAKNQGKSSIEVILDLIVASRDVVTAVVELMSHGNVEKAIYNKLSLVTSNGTGYSIDYQQKGNLVHPRCFGAFPKFLHEYVFENKILELEEAIQKITSKPVEKYNLGNRGTIEKNKIADVVIFNPKKIKDLATPADPFNYSQGIKDLFIGGEPVIANYDLLGKMTGKLVKNQ